MERNGIVQLHRVAVREQPLGVHAGAATDVDHPARGRRQHSAQDVLGSPELQSAHALAQPAVLLVPLVVAEDVAVHGLSWPGAVDRRKPINGCSGIAPGLHQDCNGRSYCPCDQG
jgi:hypothetical protein